MFDSVKLRAGDWIEIKSPAEIALTLDGEGTLDGLPFMPEMLELCGKRARILRVAEKACVEVRELRYWMREFHRNNVVILDMPRCSGLDHDGCGRACVFFWKLDWLRKADSDLPSAVDQQFDLTILASRLKTKSTPQRYFCQSTQMASATHSLSRWRIVLKCFRDVHSGSRGMLEMVRLVLFPLFRYLTRYQLPRPLVGKLKRTPVGELKLQPGELVEIKSEAEILGTLDGRGRNRGMICDRGLTQYAGRRYQVRNRLDRIICEPTGEMRAVQGTVILKGLNCHCWWRRVGGCPRDDFMYWREIWVKRVAGDKTGRVDSSRLSSNAHDGSGMQQAG
jgi:hypothetical protein